MKKTISSLNEKMWYRILKVLYILFLIFFASLVTGLNIDEGIARINQSKSLITCNYGTKIQFTPKDINIELRKYYFRDGFDYKYFSEYETSEFHAILKKCAEEYLDEKNVVLSHYIQDTSIPEEKRRNLASGLDSKLISKEDAKKMIQAKYPGKFPEQIFDVKADFTYLPFLGTITLAFLILAIVFEVIKRTFYYILLGTLKPEK